MFLRERDSPMDTRQQQQQQSSRPRSPEPRQQSNKRGMFEDSADPRREAFSVPAASGREPMDIDDNMDLKRRKKAAELTSQEQWQQQQTVRGRNQQCYLIHYNSLH